jgi:hypothetical protein
MTTTDDTGWTTMALAPYEYTGAYLLGADSRPFLDAPISATLAALLSRFDDPDADVIGIAITERVTSGYVILNIAMRMSSRGLYGVDDGLR